ncbi:4'-phosphopantetheinyl transferase family protein [Methylobacterium sp. P31]
MNAADVWLIDLAVSPARLDHCASVLDEAERDRAARFLRPADRVRYIASHAALRLILAGPLDLDPAEIRLATGAAGKPELAGSARGVLDFNLSHSGQRALVGLAQAAAIGVDIELVRPIPDAVRIARAHFAADETAILTALPSDAVVPAFFGLWTRKEAVVKALGAGLSLPLDRFSVTLPPAPPRLLRIAGGGAWTLASVDAGPNYAGTVAVRSASATVTHHTLAADWPDLLG